MELYSASDRQKIDEVNGVVRPLVDRLVQAIRGNGIRQADLFAIYPAYYEYNRIQNEFNSIVFYAQNSERIQELQVKLAVVRNELDQAGTRTLSTLYDLFRPVLASPDYVLIASVVVKCLSGAFQSELKDKLKEKEDLLRARQLVSNKAAIDEAPLAKLNELIDMKRISLDVIWRELILRFNQRPIEHRLIGDKFSELLFKGQPFEILDGDNFRFNDAFLQAVFAAQQQPQLRIRVVSILGPQNSGKSTLLNFMFGCDFTVSDGRCTRGTYGSFIKASEEAASEFDYLLVLDTEGLQSIEKSDREYDRKLILFSFAVSNIVILNTKDQITEDFNTTLEICVDSLTKIDMARVHRPAVYFVMNQKADPNKRTDQEAINKIISSFTNNGLITQLRLDETNFETLPSAFNSHTIQIKRPNHELRYCTTAPDFTKRAAALAKTIIGQAKQTAGDEAFSNIVKWMEFSNLIFTTISNYPDLTYFNTISERKQEKTLQEFLNGQMAAKMSNQVKNALFEEAISAREKNANDANAMSVITQRFVRIRAELTREFDNYTKKHAVSPAIKNFKRDFLDSQVKQIMDSWIHELHIKMGELSLRREISTGEGQLFVLLLNI